MDKASYRSFCAAIRKDGTCSLMTYNVRVLCGWSCGICKGNYIGYVMLKMQNLKYLIPLTSFIHAAMGICNSHIICFL